MDPSAKENDIIIIIIIIITVSAEEKEDDKYIVCYTHNWRFVTKIDEHVAPCWKTRCENLAEKTAAVLCNLLIFMVL